ncbi:MAG: MFS transporter [Negativicutes bacterium]|nr:MFS transporter [Negativicutes bacterium]
MINLRQKIADRFTGYLDNPTLRSNVKYSILNGALSNVAVGLTGSFMAVYALKLGSTENMLAILASGPALMGLIAQIPAAVMTERIEKKKEAMVKWALLQRICYFIFAVIPFLPLAAIYKAWLFILLVTAMNFPTNIVNTMWTQMMGEIIPTRYRGRVFGDRNYVMGWFALASMMLAGPLLDFIPYPYNYTLLFSLSFLAFMASLNFLNRTDEVKSDEAPASSVRKSNPYEGFKFIIKDQPFLVFVLAATLLNLGFGLTASMWTLNQVRDLHLNNTQIAMTTVVQSLGTTLSYPYWGRIIDRIGSKTVFLLAVFLYIFRPLVQIFVTADNLWLMWLICFITGLAQGAYALSQFNTLLEVAPDPNMRPSYLAFFNMAVQTVSFIFPMVGVQIYTRMGNQVNPVFWLSTIIRVLAAVVMASVIFSAYQKEKRAANKTQS